VDARTTRRGIPAGVIWGGLGVLAWAAFALFTGGGAAHADDGDGPLDGLTGLVSNTVSAVTAPVTPVVTQVVAPVVTAVTTPVQQAAPAVVTTVTQTVAQVPVVGPATAPVVKTVTDTAQAVVQPVVDVVKSSPVSQVTQPVIDIVTGLPIVGELVDDLGVPRVIDDVVGIVDDTTDVVGGVVDGTVPPVLEALEPQGPGIPGIPGVPGLPILSGSAGDASALPGGYASSAVPAGGSQLAASRSPGLDGARYGFGSSAAAGGPEGPGSRAPSPADDPASAPLGAPVTPSSSAGSGGGSTAATARISDDGVPPLRAEKRDPGAPDDALPASAVADTDVSPD